VLFTPQKEIISSTRGPPPSGPYSRAVKYGGLIFVSGISSKNHDDPLEDQVRQVLNNIKTILEDAGSTMDKVLKMTVILQDLNDWAKMNTVFKEFFPNDPPARTTFQSNITAKVEMDTIAC
jgi:2-iminobutanoate/2-iminopropanoate deaminase